jgi:hypothetical protein
LIAIKADAAEGRDPAIAACYAAMPGDDMNLLSLPWWCLPTALFVLSLATVLGINRWRFHRNGASQHLVLGMFVSACWIAAMVVILQRVQ